MAMTASCSRSHSTKNSLQRQAGERRSRMSAMASSAVSTSPLSMRASATITHAAEAPEYRPASKIVQYGDLNLANPQAVKRLYDRIVAAANEVCGWRDERSLAAFEHQRICTQQSITRAVAAVGNPALAVLHATKTGQPTERVAELTKR